jgi:23S rRNA U2552 (ribose-2'-O)-methylase RlmE/FtsJ
MNSKEMDAKYPRFAMRLNKDIRDKWEKEAKRLGYISLAKFIKDSVNKVIGGD